MEFDNTVFCNNLVKLRQEKGYNKYEMSIQSNIHYSYYVDIENGNLIPNFKGLISIANALNTNIACLLGEKQYSKEDNLKTEILAMLLQIKDKNYLKKLYNVLISIKTWVEINND